LSAYAGHARRIGLLAYTLWCGLRHHAYLHVDIEEPRMSKSCTHTDSIAHVTPSALGCEECLKTGSMWVHLRLCRTCGHVGCCDDSPNRHATKHFKATQHPIIEGYDPPEGWGWCFVDEVMVDLGETTPQNGPIPRYV
jgi:hypothetical protein